ncbi:MAG: efflux RND transporter permease subunit, partial [Gemmatimonadaceae bacterium]|nr:efflux RND transporter permease subunit [Gemmatimonadaceae bacterium]
MARLGIAGRVAHAFLRSKLTPLVTIASLTVGAIGLLATPREEEPQISVPMIDVSTALPGLQSDEAEQRLARPIERRMLELPGVEHVYTMSRDGAAMVTVRFRVGEDAERSLTRVQSRMADVVAELPPGAMAPVVRAYSIDDVPVFTLTLHAETLDANALRALAVPLADEIRTVPDVATTFVIGGAPRQVSVTLDPARVAASGVTPGAVSMALARTNARLQAGELVTADAVWRVDVGASLRSAADVERVVVADRGGAPVLVRDVATVTDDHGEPSRYVSHQSGSASAAAVTIAVAKRAGANATAVTHAVQQRVDAARGRLLPPSVALTVTRDYGETAGEKSRELILHLL